MRNRSVATLWLAAVLSFPAHADTASYPARHRPAAELAGLAGLAMRGARPHLVADEKSNRVTVDGPPAAVRGALKLLEELDVQPRPVELDLELRQGGEVLWSAHLRSFSGVTARASLAPAARVSRADAPAARVSRVDVRATATWVGGRYDVRVYGDVTLPGATMVLRGQVRAGDGEKVEIGSVKTPAGKPLSLAVSVRGAR